MRNPRPYPRPSTLRLAALALATGLGVIGADAQSIQSRSTGDDVPLVGLAPLFGALEAVANCPGLVIDAPRFRAAMAAYRLSTRDLTTVGRYGVRIGELAAADRTRILDDRQAFCSAAALRYAVEPSLLRVAP